MDNNKVLNALEETLKNGSVSRLNYGINEYRESAVCVNICDNLYEVCEIEKAHKRNVISYTDITAACLAVIGRINVSYDNKKELVKDFLSKL